jgi:hypothetical protein
MKFSLPSLCLCVAAALAGCKPNAEEKPDLIVLQTGRLRGNIVPVELQANAPLQHYPFLAGYIQQVRAEAAATGTPVLLVDLGDSLGGSFASHATDSANVVAFFNALDYDAIALSNLDFAVRPELLSRLNARVLNPFMGPDGKPATPGTSFSTRVEKGTIPVELWANFYGDANPAEHPDRFPAWFGDVASGVAPLRAYPEAAPPGNGGIRLLTWMKFEPTNEPPEAFLSALRKAGIAAVLAHRIYSGKREEWSQGGVIPWNPPVSANILRDNGGFALARMDLKREGDGWKVLQQEVVPMTANTAPADAAIVGEIGQFRETIASADRVLGRLARAWSKEEILGAYMQALRSVPGTDVVLYSKQSIRGDWSPGELRASAVFNCLPWTSPVVQCDLTRGQVESVLKPLGLEMLGEPGAPSDRVRVTTSYFFWRLLAAKLDLPTDAAIPTPHPSEFDFFARALETNPSLITTPGHP